MNVASVCSGIGAPEVAWASLGWRSVLMAEIEAFPRAVIEDRHRARDARYRASAATSPLLWGDFTSIRERFLKRFGRSLADIDVLVGGTPCQSFSIAGRRRSLADDRGNLSLQFVRLANAIDAVRFHAGKPPVWIVWENVPGVLTTDDNAFGAVLGGLVGGGAAVLAEPGRQEPSHRFTDAGVVAGPCRCAAWRILDAQFFGLAQRRRRVFVVARGYFGGAGQWDGPDALLPVIQGGGWHPAPRREAKERTAPTLSSRPTAGGGLGTDFDLDGGLVSHTLNAKGGGGRIDAESETFVVAHTLKAGGFDANDGVYETGDQVSCLNTATDPNQTVLLQQLGARRLTPRECERLQGLPDDYTAITIKGRPAKDGPRYKAIGNSMAVPVMAWIGARIDAIHAARTARIAPERMTA